MWLWYSHMWIRSVQVADGFRGRERTEKLECSQMKVLWAFIAAAKLIKSSPYFLMNWHSTSTDNFFSSLLAPEVMHVQSCIILVVQLQYRGNPGGISLSCPVTFIGRRSWCNIVPGKEMGSFQRALNIKSNNKGAFQKRWITYQSGEVCIQNFSNYNL